LVSRPDVSGLVSRPDVSGLVSRPDVSGLVLGLTPLRSVQAGRTSFRVDGSLALTWLCGFWFANTRCEAQPRTRN
jgi:hypothetical protein